MIGFPGFLGNETVKDALCAAYAAGRFPHAVIFQGEPGSGRHTLARLTAMALACRNPASAPCGACPSCIRAKAGSHPDIREVEGSGAAKALTVEAVRAMTEDAGRMPEEADRNFYIVYLGESTRQEAQNKLLKLLEEPPGSALFFLLCRNAQNLLPTIRSRAQSFTLAPPDVNEAAAWLAEQEQIPPEQALELAKLCGGNLGRMQQELKDGDAGKSMDIALNMCAAIFRRGGHAMLKASARLPENRAQFREVLARLEALFRDACALRCANGPVLSGAEEMAARLSTLPLKRLLRLTELMRAYQEKLERNVNGSLLTAALCMELKREA